ncbi:MAG TPA: hypothetical protein VMU95_35815 [Trebonia sp.]|nr:hypothetical protein [Trebonia sp.]
MSAGTRLPGPRLPGPRLPGRRLLGCTAVGLMAAVVAACGSASPSPGPPIPSALLGQARPIGVGPRFHPPVTGPVSSACAATLGPRDGVHVEVFAANRVLLLPAGIGTSPPRSLLDGRVTSARCYGSLVSLDPTGVVLVRPGARLTLATLFRSWGEPLSPTRLASFSAAPGDEVTVFVNGTRWPGEPSAVPLTRHAEIVLEIGPHVPPHSSYTFPPGT